MLVGRYESRLIAFCRHLLGSREDAEDVLQEVMTAAFNAMLADDRPINVRPWLYRIARNRSLNHLRRIQAIGVDSMDIHFSDNGASTADKVHEREEFRLLVGDIHELPETQKTALVLREMDALSYEQIAEAMETTVPSVKSLLVRARVSLAEAAEARLLSCDEVRIELGEIAEGLRRRPSPLVRRHLRSCERCTVFRGQLKQTNKALAALMPIGPLVILSKLALAHLGHSAGAGSSATAAGAGSGAAAGGAGARERRGRSGRRDGARRLGRRARLRRAHLGRPRRDRGQGRGRSRGRGAGHGRRGRGRPQHAPASTTTAPPSRHVQYGPAAPAQQAVLAPVDSQPSAARAAADQALARARRRPIRQRRSRPARPGPTRPQGRDGARSRPDRRHGRGHGDGDHACDQPTATTGRRSRAPSPPAADADPPIRPCSRRPARCRRRRPTTTDDDHRPDDAPPTAETVQRPRRRRPRH